MLCAFINDNLVVETKDIQVSELDFYVRKFQRVIDISSEMPVPQVNWIYDELNNKFIIPQGLNPSRIVTKLAFLNRFTDTEFQAILTISKGTSPFAIPFESFLIKLQAATFVDLARGDTISGVQSLASPAIQALTGIQVITAQRANEILTNPVQAIERPVS